MKREIKGLIIREVNLSSDSRIADILTENGIITAVVKDNKGKKMSKFASVHVCTYCVFMLFEGKSYYTVDDLEILELFWGIKNDLKLLAVAQYFCELCLALSPEKSLCKDFLRLFLNSLFYISKSVKDYRLVKLIFEMRACSMCGYMPNIVCCSNCKKYENDRMYFKINTGNICCSECNAKRDSGDIEITCGMLYALRHIVYAPIEKLFSFNLSEQAKEVLSNIAEKYIEYHVSPHFKSLEFYKKL